jgi:hypothetical protein
MTKEAGNGEQPHLFRSYCELAFFTDTVCDHPHLDFLFGFVLHNGQDEAASSFCRISPASSSGDRSLADT